ncbi:uncharacterized protein [Cherax quadricarinatus]|uniref:uncharacterized protein isoform X2 n=1 Tax=Cherax quadricarinatus TaxID=27406 RepID=UPI00237865B3|nr:uncharacterized protein LOC128695814 isoform X2 [Cherax quadricarinatus]
MGVSAGGGSLRDVLLVSGGRGTSSRGTGLTWRSLKSVSGTTDAVDPQGHFFPAKLALSLSLFKLLMAIFMVALGALALILHATLSNLGVGLWAGAVVGLCGFLGVCASRRPYAHVYVVSFMCVAILCLASSGLLIILSATAWARDNHLPTAVFIEQETQEEVEVLGEVLLGRPAVLVSGALVLLGVIDCIVSLACITVSAREACGLYTKGEDAAQGLSEGHNRKERLYRWLGQQKTIFPIGSSSSPPRMVSSVSQFVPLSSSDSSSSATPRKTSADPSAASSLPSSTDHRVHHHTGNSTLAAPSHLSSSIKGSGNKVAPSSAVQSILKPSSQPLAGSSVPPSSKHTPTHSHDRQQSLHAHMQVAYPHLHHPLHTHLHPHQISHHIPPKAPVHVHQYSHPPTHHYPAHVAHPSLYYPHLVTPMMPHFHPDQDPHQLARKHKKEGKKRKDKAGKKEKKKGKKNKELTDEQIEKTYTGLDREIAEEFIDSTMEPSVSIHRALNNSFEQESF